MNIFQKVKSEVDFLVCMEHYIGPLKQIGDDTYTTEEDICPVHGGHECFRMKYDGEDSIVNCFGNCDHDTWPVDMIEFVRIHKGLETASDAVRLIAKDFKVRLPQESPSQRILTEAASYYSNLFEMSIAKMKVLGRRTPRQFQEEVRYHKPETIEMMRIGWSDGCLVDHLREKGFADDEIIASGLGSEFKGELRDFVPSESFIYPHYWGGKVSRFTWKRMTKGRDYQMKKMHWLNGVQFYSVGSGTPVAIVEGENDLASLLDDGWKGTVLCTNGSLSKSQIDWLCQHPTEYHTYWDADDAGDKYCNKLWKAYSQGKLPELHQWAVPTDSNDIDKYLQEYELKDLRELEPPEVDPVKAKMADAGIAVIEEDGCYKIVKTTKDDLEFYIPISDFVIRLMYVKVQGDERSRVIRIVRSDGRKSKPVVVNSEAKVSLRHWKILVANAVDASFTGSEHDLAAVWSFVYATQREAVVDVPPHVGDLEGDGWLFGNQYIGVDRDIEGDADNIMWFDNEKTSGMSPKSLLAPLSSTHTSADIPILEAGDNTDEFIGDILLALNDILKDPGMSLTVMGWLRSCAYSMPLYYDAKVKFFPFLLLWGRHGKGKSTLANWMLSMYDMADKGTTTVGQLRSGVGIERKLAYYRGLPYCIDELRADRQASEYSKTWRGWYNRSSRIKGTRKSEEVIQVPLNACLFFSGQDTFTDPAMRSRCIPCKFPSNAGDTRAYLWMEDYADEFHTVGYHWIREAMNRDILDVHNDIKDYMAELKEVVAQGIPSRSVSNYGMIGYFAKDMAKEYFPDFDYKKWLAKSMEMENAEAIENDMVAYFWEGIAGLQIGDNPKLNGNHMMVKSNTLYIWYAEVFKVVNANNRGDSREQFSRGAVRDALIEEPYFLGDSTQRLGATNASRRCLAFSLEGDNVPQELLSIAETAKNSF